MSYRTQEKQRESERRQARGLKHFEAYAYFHEQQREQMERTREALRVYRAEVR
jgi:hypothetical protein